MNTRILIICLLFAYAGLLSAQTIAERITPPEGYVRTEVTAHSFAAYLRRLPLLPEGSKVLLYNGQTKGNQLAAHAVVDLDIGKRDLQQCADAVIRLRAEYLYGQKQYSAIHFNFTNGFNAEYTKWAKGNRIRVNGNTVSWYPSKGEDYSYKTFRSYLDMVFSYAGTASLSRELAPADYTDMQIGDVFIQGGHPGHAVIVVDMAVHPKTKKKVFLLAQSYMPAQHIHILTNPVDWKQSPWYELADPDEGKVYTPEWIFNKKDLKRFK